MLSFIFTLLLLANVVLSHPHLEGRAPAPPKAKVFKGCKNSNQVALTFDDGPYNYTKQIVDLLGKAKAKATFFVNGQNYRCIYEPEMASSLKYAYDKGHQIGSHTWKHANLSLLTFDQVHSEMWKVELAMQKILGVSPAMMRPPFGSYNDNVLKVAGQRNQSVIIWDFDSGDSVANQTVDVPKKYYTDLAAAKPKNVIALNHDVYNMTATDIVPHALKVLGAKKYKFVTIAECLGLEPYKKQGTTKKPGKRDSSWKC